MISHFYFFFNKEIENFKDHDIMEHTNFMEEDSPLKPLYSSSESSSPRRRIRLSRILITILILFIVGGTGFAITQALRNSNEKKIEKSTVTISPTQTPTPTETPSPTPSVSVSPSVSSKLSPSAKITQSTSGTKPISPTITSGNSNSNSSIQISVLNGSGTAGAGKKAADTLKGLGYTISSTGNADSFDYAKTEIHVKSGKTSLLTQLKKDLSSTYTIGTAATDLSSNSSSDAQVIVGKE